MTSAENRLPQSNGSSQRLEKDRSSEAKRPRKRILFLGYDHTQTALIDALIAHQCAVDHRRDKVDAMKGYDCVISFGYRHILKQSTIDGFECPVFNLHMSYLPYNRGAHPNFWSFYDNTPSGVTIHVMDGGMDTGPIVTQKYVTFAPSDDTFEKTYAVLFKQLEDMFMEFLPSMLNDTWTAHEQTGEGTLHYQKDLHAHFSGWHANIVDELKRLGG